MRLGLAAASVVAVLASSGCFGMCGLTPSEGSWNDPALFAAMPRPGTAAGATWEGPGPGLPSTIVVDPAWGPHNLTALDRLSGDPGAGTDVYVTLAPDGLSARRENTTPEADVAQALDDFLRGATTLDDAQREAHVAATLANATDGEDSFYGGDAGQIVVRHTVHYRSAAPGGLRLDGLWRELESAGALHVGLGGASSGPWTFSFSLERRMLEADGGRLEVGPTGEAHFEGFRKGERPEDSYRRDVRDWLAAHGLPAPATMHVGGSIC